MRKYAVKMDVRYFERYLVEAASADEAFDILQENGGPLIDQVFAANEYLDAKPATEKDERDAASVARVGRVLSPDECLLIWRALTTAANSWRRERVQKETHQADAEKADAFAEVFLNMPTVTIGDPDKE